MVRLKSGIDQSELIHITGFTPPDLVMVAQVERLTALCVTFARESVLEQDLSETHAITRHAAQMKDQQLASAPFLIISSQIASTSQLDLYQKQVKLGG